MMWTCCRGRKILQKVGSAAEFEGERQKGESPERIADRFAIDFMICQFATAVSSLSWPGGRCE